MKATLVFRPSYDEDRSDDDRGLNRVARHLINPELLRPATSGDSESIVQGGVSYHIAFAGLKACTDIKIRLENYTDEMLEDILPLIRLVTRLMESHQKSQVNVSIEMSDGIERRELTFATE